MHQLSCPCINYLLEVPNLVSELYALSRGKRENVENQKRGKTTTSTDKTELKIFYVFIKCKVKFFKFFTPKLKATFHKPPS